MADKIELVATGKSEADVAADLKARADEALKPVIAIMSEAMRGGLVVQFDGFAVDGFGRITVQNLRVVKVY